MRLIDADILIKRIFELVGYETKQELIERCDNSIADTEGWIGCAVEVLDEIDEMSTVKLLDWVLVTERLPEKNGRYLVTRGLKTCDALWNRVYIVNYSDLMGLKAEKIWWQGNVGKSDFERITDVLAWMPLPESYRKETEDERWS